jgi:hypothetical protein
VRDRTAIAAFLLALSIAGIGLSVSTSDLPAERTPDATFEIDGDPAASELAVEHAGGESLSSGSLRILVYEDRPVVPDRPVHGSVWETETGWIQPGDRIELGDRRFESGQRVVVRWFGEQGQANLAEASI